MVNFYIGFAAGFVVSLACAVLYSYRRRAAENRGDKSAISGTDSTVERNNTTGQRVVKEAAEAGKTVQDIIDIVRSRALSDSDNGLDKQ